MPHQIFNLGNGNGFSVREVIAAVEQVTGQSIPAVEAPRRPGDPPKLVAAGPEDPSRARLGAEEAGADRHDRRRLGVRSGPPARLQRRLARKQVRQRGKRLRHDLLGRQRSVEQADPVRLRGGELTVGVGDPLEEVRALAFEAIRSLVA